MYCRRLMCLASFVVALGLAAPGHAFAETTQFDFAGDLAAKFGPGTLDYFGASSGLVTFGTAGSFGLPALPGGNAAVMQFPAFSPSQGLVFDPMSEANGGGTMVNQYTMIWDLLVPSVTASGYMCLYQADGTNSSDGEFFIKNTGGIGVHGDYPGVVTSNEWHRIAVVVNLVTQTMAKYIDGTLVGTQTMESAVDGRHAVGSAPKTLLLTDEDNETNAGYISSFYFTDELLDDAAIAALGGPTANGVIPAAATQARDPNPADGMDEALNDVVLSWTAGKTAVKRDVYLGASFADVNDASRANPGNVLVSQGQTATTYEPATLLEYGQTYYWRVDEVNAAPDNTIFKGTTWSFTTEPYAYPITGVTAAASSEQPDSFAGNTCNGSGLDEFDQHGVDLKTMWVASMPASIQYTFDSVYKLHKLWVWNANSEIESIMGFSVKDVTIEYSPDGETWAQLENVPEFAQGTGLATYAANTSVDLGEVTAKYVKLTVNTAYGATGVVGLSEVRFFYTPAQAFEPTPADDATEIALDTTLNWRPGREATSHEVYFGTDANAVAEGTVAAETVTNHQYTPDSMNLGTAYYWRVDEVSDSGVQAGEVWTFTTEEFNVVEGFEDYDDDIDAETTIWQAWIDGVTTKASGSTVGYENSPFAEQTIVHSGKQSMPLAYNNTASPYYSEAEYEFETVQNWTGNGADEVSLWTQGYPAATSVAVAETSGKMSLTGAGADIWGTSDECTYAYKTLRGDGTLIARVVSNGAGTNTWAKGGVMIRTSLDGGAADVMMAMTGGSGNGAAFQYRTTADGTCSNSESGTALTLPYWGKIERIGDTFTGYVSADGKTWTQIGTTAISMTDPVLIGLAVTSHAAGEDRTYEFDNIVLTGTVSGVWQGAIIDSPQYNAAANMSLTISDSAGKSGTASNADIVNSADWTRWAIPMSGFTGVNFAKVKKMTITIGDKNAATAGGTGMVFIDDIGFGSTAE